MQLFKWPLLFLVSTLFLTMACSESEVRNTYDIVDFGAVADSLKINTQAIQRAIDSCHKNGGGQVLIRDGSFITGTLLLKDKVTLHIQEGAKLLGSTNPQDYRSIDTFVDATGQERGNCLIGALEAQEIGITGKGIIDGNGTAFTYEAIKAKKKELGLDSTAVHFGKNRPFLLRFVKSSAIQLKDITLRQPAAWTCHFFQSHGIEIDRVSIYSHANHNNDGIDLDSSYDVTIKNCTIDSGDDAICFKTTSPLPTHHIEVSDCSLKSEWGAIKFGTESMGDFYDISIKNCKVKDTRGGGIKILSVDGANIHDINIDNIQMKQVDMPIFVRLGERLRTYRDAEKQEVGSINKVVIKNITATTRDLKNSRVVPPSGIFLTGTPNHKIKNITLKNISITLPGGATTSNLAGVEEQVDQYPEFSFFGALPAYGLFGRHIENLDLQTTDFKTLTPDTRQSIVLEDVSHSNAHQ